MTDKIYQPLTCCDQCEHCDQSRYYTADSFEHVTAWNCRHSRFKDMKNPTSSARGEFKYPPGIDLQDTFDPKPGIPKWCPLRRLAVNRKKKKKR